MHVSSKSHGVHAARVLSDLTAHAPVASDEVEDTLTWLLAADTNAVPDGGRPTRRNVLPRHPINLMSDTDPNSAITITTLDEMRALLVDDRKYQIGGKVSDMLCEHDPAPIIFLDRALQYLNDVTTYRALTRVTFGPRLRRKGLPAVKWPAQVRSWNLREDGTFYLTNACDISWQGDHWELSSPPISIQLSSPTFDGSNSYDPMEWAQRQMVRRYVTDTVHTALEWRAIESCMYRAEVMLTDAVSVRLSGTREELRSMRDAGRGPRAFIHWVREHLRKRRATAVRDIHVRAHLRGDEQIDVCGFRGVVRPSVLEMVAARGGDVDAVLRAYEVATASDAQEP